ncbi:solute carrier family 12 member 2-like [Limulus polyphemus]|uniref:Solute carrier family 12 member 2-like n=1 Tax=Limulus polyphemus TaxID=6850 RepID=A0ABM1SIQ8_LIMPO|nr:solute carrier family 12 member 2-like [Limulus polyphemus]
MSYKFGWIRGVFIRCLLNIWGVMLFLRMGWMTAQAGIGLSIVIVVVATIVTGLTTMSMSAICTNGEVKGGGSFFLISRTLGPAFGGSIGIIFSFANCVAVAMHIVGAAETVRDLLKMNNVGIVEHPSGTNDVRIVGIILLFLMTSITSVGMAFENKAQIFLLIILLTALMDYYVGACLNPTMEQMAKGFVGWNLTVGAENFGPDFRGVDFFTVFAVFFPSVTGILAGANISGDLRDPCDAIPKGTFLSIITTSISYVLVIIWIGFTAVRDATGNVADVLNENFTNCPDRTCQYGMHNYIQIMGMSSGFEPLIYAGIFAATLSSALAALISAPRIFQAVCKDRLFPYIHFFEKGYGETNDPRRAAVLTVIISIMFTVIGELNVIAPIISNFFMANYCLLNYSCFHVSYIKSPGFRPGFKFFNKWLSLLGALLCLAVMFIMNWITALITFIVVLGLYLYLLRNKPDVNWGTSTEAACYKSALEATLKLNRTEDHVKNYRPAILVLTGNPSSRPPLVDFAYSITKKTGLMVCGHVIHVRLTMLVPYLLTTRSQWRSYDLRVFSVVHQENELDRAQLSLTALLKKFRIDTSAVTVLYGAGEPPKLESQLQFQNLISKWLVDDDSTKNPLVITQTHLALNAKKTNKHLSLREKMYHYSKDATLIVMTLPMPVKNVCPAPLYMAWLEILTQDMPPFLLIRGNQTSVLTFYSS